MKGCGIRDNTVSKIYFALKNKNPKLTISTVREILCSYVRGKKYGCLDLNKIKKIIDVVLKIDISKKIQRQEFVWGRFIFYDLATRLTNCGLSEIGSVVNRDHSTVIYGLKQVDILKEDKEFKIFLEKKNIAYKLFKEKRLVTIN